MTPDKVHEFRQRWRDIERRQRDLDFTRSQWARDLRAEFPAGSPGDDSFVTWCAQHLTLATSQARELLARAEAVELVPDDATWTHLGGFRQIRRVLPLSKANRVRVLSAAKTSDKTVASLARGLAPANDGPAVSARADAARLAAYLVSKNVPMTASIQEVVYRYVKRPTTGTATVRIRKAA